jgi:hypothetical protein
MSDDEEVEAIGWDAIDHALAAIYGDREPKHYGAILPMSLGGKDPLNGISVYKNLSPEPHYHFVTYGFSELYEKESEDPDVSGFGFELTFRLACSATDPDEPPPWPLNFLQNLARYVFKSGNAFDERHHMNLNGPIAIGESTEITAIMLLLDPELGEIETGNGHVKFLQIVGLCEDEYGVIQQGYFRPVAARVAELAPLSITELFRDSILCEKSTLDEITSADPEVNQREVFGTIAEWSETDDGLEIRIGATVIPQLKLMLKQMPQHGEAVAVYGKGTGIVFQPEESFEWQVDESLLIVSLPVETAADLGDVIQLQRGEYQSRDLNAVKVVIVPVDIRDGDGNVIKTVG